jgi:hypothetical protein
MGSFQGKYCSSMMKQLPLQLPPAERSERVEHTIELLPGLSPVKQRLFQGGMRTEW